MSIKDIGEKIKPYWVNTAIPLISKAKEGFDIKEDLFIALSIILIGLAGFGLGKLSAMEKGRESVEIKPAQITKSSDGTINFTSISSSTVESASITPVSVGIQNQSAAVMIATENAKGLLVASKSGKKYHFPWCAGASQISEKNKIWFDSYEEAQKAGYTAATNCKGLK